MYYYRAFKSREKNVQYFSVRETAEICGLSEWSVRQALKDGIFRSVRLRPTGNHRITPESIARALGCKVDDVIKSGEQARANQGQ